MHLKHFKALPADYRLLTRGERRGVRKRYVRLQKGLCAHCQAPLIGPPAARTLSQPIDARLFPPGFFDWPIHLHHDHVTGLTIGAVHCQCNARLWQYYGM